MSEVMSCEPPAKKHKGNFPDTINFCALTKFTKTEESCVRFCQDYGILPTSVMCDKCGRNLTKMFNISMNIKGRLKTGNFRCMKRNCNTKIFLHRNTWFEKSHISYKKSLFLVYCFVTQSSYDFAMKETSGPEFANERTSIETVSTTFAFCREFILQTSEEQRPIGGASLTVEVEVTKFGPGKFNKFVQWALGAVCRESNQCVLIPLIDHTRESVFRTIKAYVLPGSTLISKSVMKCLFSLLQQNYIHVGVNQAEANPEVHTNNIESLWLGLKDRIKFKHALVNSPPRLAAYLAEFLWHRKHANTRCKFTIFLEEIARFSPDSTH